MKFLFKLLLYLGLFAIMGSLLVYLFFQKEYQLVVNEYFPENESSQVQLSEEELHIAFAADYETLDPVEYNPNTRSRILNVYESLVKTNKDLQIEPSLALSWGRVSNTVWEFKLRPNVTFHDGSVFDADDVIASFNRAKKHNNSGLKDLLKTIETIERVDDLAIKIHTIQPDPILVSRVGAVLIFPSDKTKFTQPVGTAAYKFSAEKDEEFVLERFDNYWGKAPYFKYVFIKTIENRFSRLDAIKAGDIDILANVPPTFAEELEDNSSVNVLSLPSLEVNFLVFNYNSELLQDKRIREAISLAFDKEAFVEFSNGYAQPSNQFVSNGIFGFNPAIISKAQDQDEAKSIIREYDPFKRPSVSVDMALGAETIGEFVKLQLNDIGLSSNINYMPFDQLREKIFNKESEIYLLGWRSEVGDASGFFENIIHTNGTFNGGNFSNKKVDQLIDLSLNNLDEQKRLDQFHEIMQIITEEEILGVPLFETDAVYGIHVGIHFHPRLDGYILASDISKI